MSEFDFEPIPGLPAELPPSERLLWQGSPNWRSVARRVFHIRALATYCGAIVLWRIGAGWAAHQSLHTVAESALWLSGLAAATLAFLALVARFIGGTTIYSITNRRVVMRFGLAIPITLNVPFCIIEAAWVHGGTSDNGDIALQLNDERHIAYLHLWPHARPWRVNKPQPMLRCVADAAAAAEILAAALSAAGSGARSAETFHPANPDVVSRPRESAAA
jgi:hypothetical protein